MTLSAVLLVTAVVWAVSVIRSVRLRALVYSLPLPMTLALVTTDHRVDGAQVLGVLGLNLFFVTRGGHPPAVALADPARRRRGDRRLRGAERRPVGRRHPVRGGPRRHARALAGGHPVAARSRPSSRHRAALPPRRRSPSRRPARTGCRRCSSWW